MYGQVDPLLNPRSAPSSDAFFARALWSVARYGWSGLKQAIAGGQYEFPRGLFFGGKFLQPGLALYRAFLQAQLSTAKRVFVIDVHTGLGKFGKDTLLVDSTHYDTMRKVFGSCVSPLDPDRGVAYRVRGGLQSMIYNLSTQAKVLFIGQEFGTYPPLRVLRVLREENRWHQFGPGTLDHPIKAQLKETFCPDDESWRQSVLLRGSELLTRAAQIVFTNDPSIHI
jgi:hypothetical protein